MDAWALSYGSSVAFVCVSCAGPQLATQFGTELKLKNCHNTWVEEDDMPTWGQLGCNGLIVLDGSHSVVCRASPAYMQVRELAFRHVETLLQALVGSQPVPHLVPGATVLLKGLVAKPELNGQVGMCVEDEGPSGRCAVALRDGRTLSLKPCNLEVVGATVSGDGCSGGGCANGGCGTGQCALEVDPQRAEGGCTTEGCGKEGCAKRSPVEAEDCSRLDGAADGAGGGAVIKVPSVKVAVLDEEHARCEAALVQLAERRDSAALRQLLCAYEEHFAHEEALLDQHLYAGVKQEGGFSADKSARSSHFADHERMLSEIRALLLLGSDSLDDAISDAISAAEVQRLTAEFERHATAYDGGYADRLSAAMAL
uniref:Hemerythrin-like domain-containing protein n=1 Tax=Haptolina ericina TaxID=156174 RepID=A0A7S3EY25_9EUKA|mmetsp:Transcript_29568/g.66914  ORF Transcript_29568/g.66914 Transcript_29568/m.66914 type:complete len:369 (+) Transcript_29568:252-1358(+)